jgi:hypothetical protein
VPYPGHSPSPVSARAKSPSPPINYMQDVPLKLSAQLTRDDNSEITRYQVNEILSSITKNLQLSLEYDFQLERSVLSEG